MTTDPSVKNRLLIVDDEPTNIHILSNILSSDYEIRAANNGERAIEAALSQSPDLILLDMIMPEINGEETFRLLNSIDPEVKVIMSSGYLQERNASDLLDLGILGMLQKPFRKNELALIIKGTLQPDH